MRLLYILLFTFIVFSSNLLATNKTVLIDNNGSVQVNTYLGQQACANFVDETPSGALYSTGVNFDNYCRSVYPNLISATGSHYNTYSNKYQFGVRCYGDLIIHNVYKCVIPTPFPKEISRRTPPNNPNMLELKYDDGSSQFCDNGGGCLTFDTNGKVIPNIPIDGKTYATSAQIQTHNIVLVGGLAIASALGAAAIVATGGLAAPAVVATLGTGAVTTGVGSVASAFTGASTFTLNTPTSNNVNTSSSNPIQINLTSSNFGKESPAVSNSVSSSGNKVSTVTSSNGSTTSTEFTPTNIVSSNTAPDGTVTTTTIPNSALAPATPATPAQINSNGLSSANNPPSFDYTVKIQKPTVINNNGTITKGSTSTVVNHYNSKTFNTTIVNSSGTTSNTSSSSVGSSSTSLGSSSSSNGVTSSTSTDLTPITSRLDQIISQNTLLNSSVKDSQKTNDSKLDELIKKATDRNTKLDDIKQAINDINATDMKPTNKKLDTLHSDLNSTNSLLSDIKGLLKSSNSSNSTIPKAPDANFTQTPKDCGFWHEHFNTTTKRCECDAGWSRNIVNNCLIYDANTTTNKLLKAIADKLKTVDKNATTATAKGGDANISKITDSSKIFNAVASEFSTFRDNIMIQNDRIKAQATSLQAVLKGGFVNNLPTATVTTCPYNKTINFGFAQVPFNIDVCSIFSNLYSTFYFLFYIVFFATALNFTFKLLFNTRSE